MSKKLAVICLNGYGGFLEWRSRRRRRTMISDAVRDLVKFWRHKGKSIDLLVNKGDFIHRADRNARNFIKDHANGQYNLLLVGKSHGAYDLIKNVLPDTMYHDMQAFDKRGIVLIDANKGPRVRNLNHKTWHVKHELTFAFNVFQRNRLGGAQITCDSEYTRNTGIPDSTSLKMNHWNIESHPVSIARIAEGFSSLLK